ncbi:IS30 family transposase [Pseudonocardia sp. Ae717_Ps2]|uniref:IS30 family transposase n=1 Tax=Pseudonocardia sp. Ae717_Ps2 TaxID=1885573 RepID=UPI0013017376|nr:IS30 family transposase [Pseudonocardia sp. Ae717_Ps2]
MDLCHPGVHAGREAARATVRAHRPTRRRQAPTGPADQGPDLHRRPPPPTPRGAAVPGHWEGDLVIGKNGKTAVATLVERTSRFLVLVPLTGRDALTVGRGVIAATSGLPAHMRASLTWDCGAEMAGHATVTKGSMPVYLAHPHSPWERGSNENLNRIVREYFPKGTDITSDPKYLAMVACDINDRPP